MGNPKLGTRKGCGFNSHGFPHERPYIGSAVEHVSAQSFCPAIVVTHPDALLKIE